MYTALFAIIPTPVKNPGYEPGAGSKNFVYTREIFEDDDNVFQEEVRIPGNSWLRGRSHAGHIHRLYDGIFYGSEVGAVAVWNCNRLITV